MSKLEDNDLVKLKMVLLAMNFSETFDCIVAEVQFVAVDDDNEYIFNLKMKDDLEEEK